jgi:hypothetical protein
MKDSYPLPIKQRQSIQRPLLRLVDACERPHQPESQHNSQVQSSSETIEEPSVPDALIFTRVPRDSAQSRIVRERTDRTTLEDKIRRAVDGWTEEERATAYWYLYACGMTLERAKAIRHKGGFHT